MLQGQSSEARPWGIHIRLSSDSLLPRNLCNGTVRPCANGKLAKFVHDEDAQAESGRDEPEADGNGSGAEEVLDAGHEGDDECNSNRYH